VVDGFRAPPRASYGRTEEASELIAFPASDCPSYITDQDIRIDDGITRSV
jgi:NAD(P)-dependent dehydrogenase (short-subunit alcohol dehydrogenase family)